MSRWKHKRKKKVEQSIPHTMLNNHQQEEIDKHLENTIQFMQDFLSDNDDFVIRRFSIFGTFTAALFYINPLVDSKEISEKLLKPLMNYPEHLNINEVKNEQIIDVLSEKVLYHSHLQVEAKLSNLVNEILKGQTVLAINEVKEAVILDTLMVEKRDIDNPETEQVIIGPREGFIENLETNIGLLRYRLPTPDFCLKMREVGRLTKSKVAICYMKGITDQALIDEVELRLENIDIDAVLDVGYLEQFIEDSHFSPFPQTLLTERPDSAVGNLIEGRVAVLVDGSPFALLVPVVFSQFYQVTEDYSTRFLMGSFIRLIRMVALVISVVLPSLYVSIISFNPALIPSDFAVAVSGGRAGVPYPAVVEVLLFESAMEILREATVRLPQLIGSALSIVGVLVIGDAAVNAGFVSPMTVVIIAITTIASFSTPIYNASFALRMIRFPLIILSGLFGIYGMMLGIIYIFCHMLSLKSYGVPYMSPVSPENAQGMKDTVVRFPFQWMPRRPAIFNPKNATRMVENKPISAKPNNPLGPSNHHHHEE